MILLQLFLTFLKIGAVSFGGGYAMISIIRDECLANGWLAEEEILNFIAVAESTPGPIAVNMATFVGSSQGGILGSLLATLGVILPSFIIILTIASLLKSLMKYGAIKATIQGIRPAVIAMILATAITMALSLIIGIKNIGMGFDPDLKAACIFIFIFVIAFGYKRLRKKPISPILLILISGGMGALLYGI